MPRSPIALLCAPLCACAALSAAPMAPVPAHLMPKDPAYFPTAVGTVWVYTQPEYEMKLVVTKAEKAGEGTLVSVENVVAAGKTLPIHKVLVSRTGLAWAEEAGEAYTPPVGLLRLPHRPADVWRTSSKRTVAAKKPFVLTFEAEMTDCGEEEVRVPAGAFRALRVDSEVSLNGNKERVSRWYAPGVGLVKEQRPHTVRELKSFDPTGASAPK
jgi:hypothetical protein